MVACMVGSGPDFLASNSQSPSIYEMWEPGQLLHFLVPKSHQLQNEKTNQNKMKPPRPVIRLQE